MAKKIILPLFLMSTFTFYFYDLICSSSSLLESISHTSEEYLNLFKNGLLLFENAVPGAEHLWYLYIYILIVLLFPFLFKCKEVIDRFNYKKVILCFYILMLLNDITLNKLFLFSHHMMNAVFPSIIFIYTGYLLYKNPPKNHDRNLIKSFLWLFVFMIVNLIRMGFIYNNYGANSNTLALVKWYTSFSLVNVISLYYFSYYLFINLKESRIFSYIGKSTFIIYLIHYMVFRYYNKIGIHHKILSFVNESTIIYQVLYTVLVFITSFILSLVISLIIKILSKMIIYVKNYTTMIKM